MLLAGKRQRYVVRAGRVSKLKAVIRAASCLSATTDFFSGKNFALKKKKLVKLRFSQAAFVQLHIVAGSLIFDINPVNLRHKKTCLCHFLQLPLSFLFFHK